MFLLKKRDNDFPDYEKIIRPFLISESEHLWYMEKQRAYGRGIKRMMLRSWLEYPLELFYFPLRRFLKGQERKSFDRINDHVSLSKTTRRLHGECVPGRLRRIRLKRRFEKEKKDLRNHMERCISEFDLNEERFFYFPLHYQPEQTTTPMGGHFSDQIYLLREISKALPGGCKIVVKEHPSQFSSMLRGNFGRYPGFWKELSSIENVVLVSPSVSSRELIKKTLAVITVTGTAGWEAIVNDKPCVYFGYPWYSRFPQALSGSLSNLQGTLNELVRGDRRVPELDADTVNNCFFDFAINCDLHGYNSGHADRNPEKMVDYLIQYCVPIQRVGDGYDAL